MRAGDLEALAFMSGSARTTDEAPTAPPAPIEPAHRRGLGPTTREALLVVAGASALAVLMTWPTLRNPTRTIEHNLGDPTLEAWAIAWPWHILRQDPTQLWNGNGFYPEPLSFAYTDSFFGYSFMGLIGHGPVGAVLAVNLVYVLITALATIGGYALARQLGASWGGAAVAGVAVAYAPWRLIHAGHLHVISTGGIMLALAMLARGHGWSLRDGYRPERCRRGWILGGWFVAAWQMTIGFGIGLVFAYVLAGLAVLSVAAWFMFGRPKIAWRYLAADAAGGLFLLAVTAFMARPYLKVVERFPYARRTETDLAFYSPPLRGFFIGPHESLFWRTPQAGLRETLPVPAEMALLPGFVLYGLAALGVFVSIWTLRQRLLLIAAIVASVALAMGTQVPGGSRFGYVTLYRHLPGFDGLRTPGRLVIWTTLLLALLAAGAVTRLGALLRTHAWRRPAQLAAPVAVLLVLIEGLSGIPHPAVPPAPAALRSENAGIVRPPLLVLPSDTPTDQLVMLWSTDGFPRMVNGSSGLGPVSQGQIRGIAIRFPDQASVAQLRRYGIATVVVLRDRIAGTPWAGAADAPITGLDITREEIDHAVVYHLR
jgi:hypothetical protein